MSSDRHWWTYETCKGVRRAALRYFEKVQKDQQNIHEKLYYDKM